MKFYTYVLYRVI